MDRALTIEQPSHYRVRSAMSWVLVPAVVMSLGWGLRGYIGGGPHGAMIPGALVAMMLCRFLGYDARSSAVVVAFSTIGVGLGGEMTYGQTLGLIRDDPTFVWGLTGTTLKGAVWGLLGGAMIGLGFVARHISWWTLIVTFLTMLAAIVAGIYFVNEPKLIYFSNPIDRPRDESWAGLLFGGLALLACSAVLNRKPALIPARFALYGLIGGGIGFGGGSLFLAAQPDLPETWRWLPCWKFMEFTFGFLFGAALGLCAFHARHRLAALEVESCVPPTTGRRSNLDWIKSAVAGITIVCLFFYGWNFVLRMISPYLRDLPPSDIRRTIAGVLLVFPGMGVIQMLLARRWQSAAWQIAVSITIVAAAIDWQRDLLPRGKIDMPETYRNLYVAGMGLMSILFVAVWQNRRAPRVMSLFLFATCVLMGIGYMMGLGESAIWWSDPTAVAAAGGRGAYLWQTFRSEIIVHTIFTMLFLLSLAAGVIERRREGAALAVSLPAATQ